MIKLSSLISKKLLVTLLFGVVLKLNHVLHLDFDDATIYTMVSGLITYLVTQGVVDFQAQRNNSGGQWISTNMREEGPEEGK